MERCSDPDQQSYTEYNPLNDSQLSNFWMLYQLRGFERPTAVMNGRDHSIIDR